MATRMPADGPRPFQVNLDEGARWEMVEIRARNFVAMKALPPAFLAVHRSPLTWIQYRAFSDGIEGGHRSRSATVVCMPLLRPTLDWVVDRALALGASLVCALS